MSIIAIDYKDGVPEEPEFSAVYRTQVLVSYDSWVDFCVWILRVDGLKFPPFISHESGNGCLRDIGFNEEQWKRWVHRIAFLNDERLWWSEENTLDEDFPVTEEWIHYIHLSKKFSAAQNKLAISMLPEDSLNLAGCSWEEIWDGDSKILDKLIDLYNEWKLMRSDKTIEIISLASDAVLSGSLPQHEQIAVFRIELITYPASIMYPLCATSGILGASGINDLCHLKDLSIQLLNELQNISYNNLIKIGETYIE